MRTIITASPVNLRQKILQNRDLGISIGAVILAFIVGIVSSLLPWWLVLIVSLIPVAFLIAWHYSDIATLVIIALQFGVLSKLMPKIPFGGGSLNAEDIFIPLLLLISIVKNTGNLHKRLALIRPYYFPLILLFLCALTSSIIAITYKTAPIKDVLNEFRPYLTWLLLPLFCLTVDSDLKLKRFSFFIFNLSVVIATGMIFQSLSGYEIFDKGQELRDLYTLGGSSKGVIRSETPGQFLMVAALVYLFAGYVKGTIKHLFLFIFLCAILSGGIIVGFGRGLWLSIIISIIALFFYSNKSDYFKFILSLSVIFIILISGLIFSKPDYAEALGNRFFSVAEEVQSGSSLGRRKEENDYAIQKIIDSPIIGVGLGGQYKPYGRETSTWENESRYIHNTYVRIATKMGIPGFAIILIFVFIMWKRTFSAMNDLHINQPLAFATFWTIVTTTLLTAATQPNLAAPNGVATIALALFLSEAYRTSTHINANTPTVRNISSIGVPRV